MARQREAIFFAAFGAADRLRGAGARHVFHMRPSLADEARRKVGHCAALGQDRIAVLGGDARGVIVPQVVPSPRLPTTPLVREYLAALDSGDQSPSCEGLEGFNLRGGLKDPVRPIDLAAMRSDGKMLR